MNITITSLTMINFKGIKQLTLDFADQNAILRGQNATGKTSVMDAWLWLLFGKDSANRADFSVKPQARDGGEVHHLETTVEAVLSIDGRESVIARTLSEKWVTKRGFDTAEFVGNETSFVIDGVPKKAGEWSAWVTALVKEDVFRMLSNPLHFNTALLWKDRRAILFGMIDPMDDRAYALSNAKYDKVADLLDKHSIEDARKAIAFQIKALEKERDGITPRIDELTRSVSAVEPSAAALAESGIEKLKAELQALDISIEDAQAVSANIQGIYQKISLLENQKAQRIREAEREANRERDEGLRALDKARSDMAAAFATTAMLIARIEDKKRRLQDTQVEMTQARKLWSDVYERAYQAPDGLSDTCPTCNQPFPAAMLEEKADTLRAAWQAAKDKELARITAYGQELKAHADAVQEEISDVNAQIERNKEAVTAAKLQVDALDHWGTATVVFPQVDTTAEDAAIAQLQAEAMAPASTSAAALRGRRSIIMEEMQDLQRTVLQARQRDEAEKRIAELLEREREIGEKITALDGQRYLLEQLVADKCAALEAQINALFPTVRWKLFDTAINGGVTDCCECMIGGVPYPDANNAARINAGLEIIDRLCRWMNAHVPIFIDNAESVNLLRPTASQTISLVVSYDQELCMDKAMREVA